MKILLVEPGYPNKYPPLGLMKISTFHKERNDTVVFVKGKNKELRSQIWDRIYITTLFSFYWETTISTIKYYLKSVNEKEDVFVGGIMASILIKQMTLLQEEYGFTHVKGILDRPNMLNIESEVIIDRLVPDYSIIETSINTFLKRKYPVDNAFIGYMTRGCIRNCSFCAVPTLEPTFNEYISIKDQIRSIEDLYGPRRNLMLLDNNVLASNKLKEIVDELVDLGFGRDNRSYIKSDGLKERYVRRHIDFNQGTDARLLDEEKMKLLSKLEIRPLRIAFDNYKDRDIYVNAMRIAARSNVRILSNYMLFNFLDAPEDLYRRIELTIQLNEEFSQSNMKTTIWSFPMRFSPIKGSHSLDRKFVGKQWSKKELRAIQCILNATHGVVGAKRAFFEHAYGKSIDEFRRILLMPEEYILNRKKSEASQKISEYNRMLDSLDEHEQNKLYELVKENAFSQEVYESVKCENDKLGEIYKTYLKMD